MRLSLGANFCDKCRSEMFNEFYKNYKLFLPIKNEILYSLRLFLWIIVYTNFLLLKVAILNYIGNSQYCVLSILKSKYQKVLLVEVIT